MGATSGRGIDEGGMKAGVTAANVCVDRLKESIAGFAEQAANINKQMITIILVALLFTTIHPCD